MGVTSNTFYDCFAICNKIESYGVMNIDTLVAAFTKEDTFKNFHLEEKKRFCTTQTDREAVTKSIACANFLNNFCSRQRGTATLNRSDISCRQEVEATTWAKKN
ncbi:MAG: hypothetical protein GXZ13_06095 [Synergistaceae bacterium]|jgi:phenylalanine-4-hydroxylase|nr:hypothetical protein [Synergistaceae bacterium]